MELGAWPGCPRRWEMRLRVGWSPSGQRSRWLGRRARAPGTDDHPRAAAGQTAAARVAVGLIGCRAGWTPRGIVSGPSKVPAACAVGCTLCSHLQSLAPSSPLPAHLRALPRMKHLPRMKRHMRLGAAAMPHHRNRLLARSELHGARAPMLPGAARSARLSRQELPHEGVLAAAHMGSHAHAGMRGPDKGLTQVALTRSNRISCLQGSTRVVHPRT